MSAHGIGLLGAGAFGEFCLAAFAPLPGVFIAAVCDSDAARAEHFAARYQVPAYTSVDALLADRQVSIVALNTPPHLHAQQGLAALHAGKHLFCEKPLALTLEDAGHMIAAAESAGTLLTVDYVMRQNPLWAAAAALCESGLLGALLQMDLANHAAGLNLAPHHWFWNKAHSGGIWIEHGVHFFDAFAWVAGEPGEITAAQSFTRADGRENRVEALARYGDAAAHFYHGFTHTSADEQTVVRLAFEHGYVTLDEWVPTQLRLLTTASPDVVRPMLPGAVSVQAATGGQTLLTATLTEGKSAVYRRAIQDGMSQLAQAANGDRQALRVTGAHGLASLRMALDAERMGAKRHNPG
jgi:predicted dehydrogenase